MLTGLVYSSSNEPPQMAPQAPMLRLSPTAHYRTSAELTLTLCPMQKQASPLQRIGFGKVRALSCSRIRNFLRSTQFAVERLRAGDTHRYAGLIWSDD
jgi:hypothetical protein